MAECIHTDIENDDMGRCVCTADTLQNLVDMLVCLPLSELELQDGVLQLSDEYLSLQDSPEIQGFSELPLERILFTRVRISGSFLSVLLNILPKTNVRQLDFTEATLEALPHPHNPTQPSPITNLRMERVTFDPSLFPLNVWLLSSLTHLTLRGMPGVLLLGNEDCVNTPLFTNLTELDISESSLTDESLANLSHCLLSPFMPPASLSISVLRLSHNQLRTLQGLCPLLQASPYLVELDLSHNTLNDSAFGFSYFNSSNKLRSLNLSYMGIQATDGLMPASVEVLDLRGNQLREFRNPPQGILDLYLSDNHLIWLPDLVNATRLKTLTLDGNWLTDLSGASTLEVVIQNLSAFRAGRNPFTCGCEMKESVGILKRNHDKVLDWPDAFLCTPPKNSTITRLEDLDFSNCDQAVNKASPGIKMNVDFALCMSAVVAVSAMLM